ncbi:hypothetical protein [Streptomyces lonarensis]|uniref:DUF4034 domain-containing protein n=1 Tax=Streptomyces lonarensis TaxID=700599 RepID=A0A7X6D3M0_9ACTN|nr:hypothetical protein [Streptomyces lonarensis]NJQ07403.1 hypothetical protein [Streptomyces lonarensis]
MEALWLLIALTAIFGVAVLPAIRRRQERRALEQAAETAHGMTRPAGSDRPRQKSGGVSLSKEGDADAGSAGGSVSAGGLVAVDDLDLRLPGPDQELVDALEETQRNQDWRPVGRLLALTDDHEQRWQRVQSVAGAAAMELAHWRGEHGTPPGENDHPDTPVGPGARRDAGWLQAWRAEEPSDVGGAQVYAQFLVWQAMSNTGSADSRIILEEARTAAADAALLAPDDPTPHITELFVARGLSYRKPDFEQVWSQVTRRSRDHMGAHLAALSYWSEAWHGSKEEAYGFAQSAAGSAPPRSLLPALPLFAVYDHLPDVQLSPSMYSGATIGDALEAARFALSHTRPDHPVVPHVRHLLLWFLVRAERYPEAAEQVWAVDGYVGALPWVNSGNPAQEYAAFRAVAIGRR